MPNVKNNLAAQETRRRLLQAAGEVFAEKGPHAATTKEITERAGVNIAAINYHFKDKAELYVEVIRRIEAEAAAIIPSANALTGNAEQRFCKCVRHIALTMLGRGQPPWERVLLARELAWPSPAMRSLLDNVGKPLNQIMGEVIGELIDRAPTTEIVGHLSASVIGQCVYYLQHHSQLEILYPQFKRPQSAERIAEHIVAFSLAGVSAHAKKASRIRHRAASSQHAA
jgi:AcrR family transcriptional regulator